MKWGFLLSQSNFHTLFDETDECTTSIYFQLGCWTLPFPSGHVMDCDPVDCSSLAPFYLPRFWYTLVIATQFSKVGPWMATCWLQGEIVRTGTLNIRWNCAKHFHIWTCRNRYNWSPKCVLFLFLSRRSLLDSPSWRSWCQPLLTLQRSVASWNGWDGTGGTNMAQKRSYQVKDF